MRYHMKVLKIALVFAGILAGVSLAHAAINVDPGTYHRQRMEEKKARAEAEKNKPAVVPAPVVKVDAKMVKPETQKANNNVTVSEKVESTNESAVMVNAVQERNTDTLVNALSSVNAEK